MILQSMHNAQYPGNSSSKATVMKENKKSAHICLEIKVSYAMNHTEIFSSISIFDGPSSLSDLFSLAYLFEDRSISV